MLGKRSAQWGLFEADTLYGDFVGRRTFFGYLAYTEHPTVTLSATLRLPQAAATAGTRRLLVLTGLGPIAFLAIASVADALAPAYDPVSQTISDLVFTPLGWLQTLNFYLFGAATIGFGIALAQILGGNSARTSGVLLAVSGFSLIAAGLFPAIVEDGEPTPSMLVHGLAFFFTFLPLPGAYAFAAIRLRDDRSLRGFASYTAALPSLVFFSSRSSACSAASRALHSWRSRVCSSASWCWSPSAG